jgi:folate-binding protein YgfZ
LHEIALHGPGAGEVLGLKVDAPLQSDAVSVFDVDAVVWRDDPCGVPGYHVILPSESARQVWMSLIGRFGSTSETAKRLLRPIGWAAFNACRIEGGRPILGIDFDGAPVPTAAPGKKDASTDDSGAGALPAETALFDRAVSITKGCYLGQEIVARMHARGQVARQVCGIRMEGDALPIAGAQVLDEQSNTIGVITSSTISPVLSNAPLCLGMVKRPHFTLGTRLKVPAEGAVRDGIVVALPFL